MSGIDNWLTSINSYYDNKSGKVIEPGTPSLTMGGQGMGYTNPMSPIDLTDFERYTGRPLLSGNYKEDMDYLTELRAQNQTAADQWANGVVKFGGKVATNIIGAAAMLPAAVQAAVEGDFSKLYDNAMMNALDDANNWLDEKLPIYRTKAEQDMSLLRQMGTSAFWADDFLGGMSFLVAAVLTEGGAAMAGARMFPKAVKLAKRLQAIEKAGKVDLAAKYSQLGNARRFWDLGILGRQVYTGAGYESAVEAHHYKKEAMAALTEQYIQQTGQEPDEAWMMQTEQEVNSLANGVFGLNLALVSAGNWATLDKTFGQPLSRLIKSKNFPFSKDLSKYKTGIGETSKLELPELTKFERAMKGTGKLLSKPFMEGVVEEGGQGVISGTALDYAVSKYNPEGIDNAADMGESFFKSLEETYGTKEGLKEVLIGALMGTFGMWAPGKGWEGSGLKDAFMEWTGRAENPHLQLFDNYNNRKDSLVMNSLAHATRQKEFNSRMEKAAENGDMFRAKTAENMSLYSWMDSRAAVGLLDQDAADLKQGIKDMKADEFKQQFGYPEHMTEEEVKQRKEEVMKSFDFAIKQFSESRRIAEKAAFNQDDGELVAGLGYSIFQSKMFTDRENKIVAEMAELGIDLTPTKEIGKLRQLAGGAKGRLSQLRKLLQEQEDLQARRNRLTEEAKAASEERAGIYKERIAKAEKSLKETEASLAKLLSDSNLQAALDNAGGIDAFKERYDKYVESKQFAKTLKEPGMRDKVENAMEDLEQIARQREILNQEYNYYATREGQEAFKKDVEAVQGQIGKMIENDVRIAMRGKEKSQAAYDEAASTAVNPYTGELLSMGKAEAEILEEGQEPMTGQEYQSSVFRYFNAVVDKMNNIQRKQAEVAKASKPAAGAPPEEEKASMTQEEYEKARQDIIDLRNSALKANADRLDELELSGKTVREAIEENYNLQLAMLEAIYNKDKQQNQPGDMNEPTAKGLVDSHMNLALLDTKYLRQQGNEEKLKKMQEKLDDIADLQSKYEAKDRWKWANDKNIRIEVQDYELQEGDTGVINSENVKGGSLRKGFMVNGQRKKLILFIDDVEMGAVRPPDAYYHNGVKLDPNNLAHLKLLNPDFVNGLFPTYKGAQYVAHYNKLMNLFSNLENAKNISKQDILEHFFVNYKEFFLGSSKKLSEVYTPERHGITLPDSRKALVVIVGEREDNAKVYIKVAGSDQWELMDIASDKAIRNAAFDLRKNAREFQQAKESSYQASQLLISVGNSVRYVNLEAAGMAPEQVKQEEANLMEVYTAVYEMHKQGASMNTVLDYLKQKGIALNTTNNTVYFGNVTSENFNLGITYKDKESGERINAFKGISIRIQKKDDHFVFSLTYTPIAGYKSVTIMKGVPKEGETAEEVWRVAMHVNNKKRIYRTIEGNFTFEKFVKAMQEESTLGKLSIQNQFDKDGKSMVIGQRISQADFMQSGFDNAPVQAALKQELSLVAKDVEVPDTAWQNLFRNVAQKFFSSEGQDYNELAMIWNSLTEEELVGYMIKAGIQKRDAEAMIKQAGGLNKVLEKFKPSEKTKAPVPAQQPLEKPEEVLLGTLTIEDEKGENAGTPTGSQPQAAAENEEVLQELGVKKVTRVYSEAKGRLENIAANHSNPKFRRLARILLGSNLDWNKVLLVQYNPNVTEFNKTREGYVTFGNNVQESDEVLMSTMLRAVVTPAIIKDEQTAEDSKLHFALGAAFQKVARKFSKKVTLITLPSFLTDSEMTQLLLAAKDGDSNYYEKTMEALETYFKIDTSKEYKQAPAKTAAETSQPEVDQQALPRRNTRKVAPTIAASDAEVERIDAAGNENNTADAALPDTPSSNNEPVFSLAAEEDTSSAGFEEMVDNLAAILPMKTPDTPEGVFSVKDIETLVKNMHNKGVPMGAFLNHVIYLRKEGATRGVEYHEAFHAVFRTFLNNAEIDKYLAEARKKYKKPGKQELRQFRMQSEARMRLSEQELENLWYEEQMAEDFRQYALGKNKKKSFFRKLWEKFLRWMKALTETESDLGLLYAGIMSGKFKNASVKYNVYSKTAVPVYSLLNSVVYHPETIYRPSKLSVQDTALIVSMVTNYMIRNKISSPTKQDVKTAMQVLAQTKFDINKWDDIMFENSKTEGDYNAKVKKLLALSSALDNTVSVINTKDKEVTVGLQSTVQEDNAAILLEQVNQRLTFFSDEVFEDAEDNEFSEDETGNTTELFAKESNKSGGFNSESKAFKMYITTKVGMYDYFKIGMDVNLLDEAQKEMFLFPIDAYVVYGGVMSALKNVPKDKLLQVITTWSHKNPQSAMFVTELVKDIRLELEQQGILVDGEVRDLPQDILSKSNFYNMFVATFNVMERDYMHINIDTPDESRNYSMANVFHANQSDVDDLQFDQWHGNYMASNLTKKDMGDVLDNLSRLRKQSFSNENELEKLTNAYDALLQKTGIQVSKMLIRYSLIKEAFAPKEDETPLDASHPFYAALLNELDSFQHVEGYEYLNNDFFMGIATAVENAADGNMYVIPEGAGNNKKGAVGRLKRLAYTNSFFDETVGSTTLQNSTGETVHIITKPAFDTKLFQKWQAKFNKKAFDNFINAVGKDDAAAKEALKELMGNFIPNNQDLDMYYNAIKRNPLFRNPKLFRNLAPMVLFGARSTDIETDESGRIRTKQNQLDESGVDYSDLDEAGKLLMMMTLFETSGRSLDSQNKRLHVTNILSDKITAQAYALPLFDALDSGGTLSEAALDQLYAHLEQDYERVENTKREIIDIIEGRKVTGIVKNYHYYHDKDDRRYIRHPEGQVYEMIPVVINTSQGSQLEGYDFVPLHREQASKYKDKEVRGDKLFQFSMAGLDASKKPTRQEAANAINKYIDNLFNLFVEEISSEHVGLIEKEEDGYSNRYLTQSYLEEDADNKVNLDQVKRFFVTDLVNTMNLNNLIYGDPAYSHKDFIDVVKRNAGLIASGTESGSGVTKAAVVGANSEMMGMEKDREDSVLQAQNKDLKQDVQDGQTYAYWKWYTDKYLLSTAKYSPKVKEIFNYVRAGIPLTKEQLEVLEDNAALLNDRKMAMRDIFFYGKTSVHTNVREKTSYIAFGFRTNQNYKELLLEVWDAIESNNPARASELLEQEFEDVYDVMNYLHTEVYKPIKGYEYHHNLLNEQELKGLHLVLVSSASKMMTVDQGVADESKIWTSPFYIADENNHEQVKTDNIKKEIVHGTQLIGLVWSEQQDDIDVDVNGMKTKLGEVRKAYIMMVAERAMIGMNKKSKLVLDEEGNVNYDTIWDYIKESMNSSAPDPQLMVLFGVTANQPDFNWNMPSVYKKIQAMYRSFISKGTLKHTVAGFKYTLVSDYGHKVIVDKNDKVIPKDVYLQNPNRYRNNKTRRLKYQKSVNANGVTVYYVECIVPQSILDKYGLEIGDPAVFDSDILEQVGVRIPTQDKHSMVVLKPVDFLPAIYGTSIIMPSEAVFLAGADFDIDSLFARRFEVLQSEKAVVKFGDYLKATSNDAALDAAYEEYVESQMAERENKKALKQLAAENQAYQRLKEDIASTKSELKSSGSPLAEVVLRKSLKDSQRKLREINRRLIGDLLEAKGMSKESFLREFRDTVLKNRKHFHKGDLSEIKPLTLQETNNLLMAMEKALMMNEGNESIAKTKASLDLFKDKETGILKSLEDKGYITKGQSLSIASALDKAVAAASNDAGKTGIGPAALWNILYQRLVQYDIQLTESNDFTPFFGFTGFEKSYQSTVNGKVVRVNDVISTVITAMTDNAKEQLAAILNLTPQTLSPYLTGITMGVPVEMMTMYMIQPAVKKMQALIVNERRPIKTKKEQRAAKLKTDVGLERFERQVFTEVVSQQVKGEVDELFQSVEGIRNAMVESLEYAKNNPEKLKSKQTALDAENEMETQQEPEASQPAATPGKVSTYRGEITSLKENQVFVFGSNPIGVNGNAANNTGGAALSALKNNWVKQGEKMDNAMSQTGKSYGLVTVTAPGSKLSKTEQEIIENIKKMYDHAEKNPGQEFLVAYTMQKGKYLNGYTPIQMAAMFSAHPIPSNVVFEERFAAKLTAPVKSTDAAAAVSKNDKAYERFVAIQKKFAQEFVKLDSYASYLQHVSKIISLLKGMKSTFEEGEMLEESLEALGLQLKRTRSPIEMDSRTPRFQVKQDEKTNEYIAYHKVGNTVYKYKLEITGKKVPFQVHKMIAYDKQLFTQLVINAALEADASKLFILPAARFKKFRKSIESNMKQSALKYKDNKNKLNEHLLAFLNMKKYLTIATKGFFSGEVLKSDRLHNQLRQLRENPHYKENALVKFLNLRPFEVTSNISPLRGNVIHVVEGNTRNTTDADFKQALIDGYSELMYALNANEKAEAFRKEAAGEMLTDSEAAYMVSVKLFQYMIVKDAGRYVNKGIVKNFDPIIFKHYSKALDDVQGLFASEKTTFEEVFGKSEKELIVEFLHHFGRNVDNSLLFPFAQHKSILKVGKVGKKKNTLPENHVMFISPETEVGGFISINVFAGSYKDGIVNPDVIQNNRQNIASIGTGIDAVFDVIGTEVTMENGEIKTYFYNKFPLFVTVKGKEGTSLYQLKSFERQRKEYTDPAEFFTDGQIYGEKARYEKTTMLSDRHVSSYYTTPENFKQEWPQAAAKVKQPGFFKAKNITTKMQLNKMKVLGMITEDQYKTGLAYFNSVEAAEQDSASVKAKRDAEEMSCSK